MPPVSQGLFQQLMDQYKAATQETPEETALKEHLIKLRSGLYDTEQAPSMKQSLFEGLAAIAPILAGVGIGGARAGAEPGVAASQLLQTQFKEKREKASDRAAKKKLGELELAQERYKGIRADKAAKLQATQAGFNAGYKMDKMESDAENAKARQKNSALRTDAYLGLREEALKNTKDAKFRDEVNRYSTRIISDPVIKEMQKQGISLDAVGGLATYAKQGNSIASNAMGAKMARAMGEVGVLTEEDVKRYVTSGRLDRKAADTLNKWMKGRPTDATIGEIQQISAILQEEYGTKVQTRTNRYVREFAKTHGMTPEEASDWLQHPYTQENAPTGGLTPEKQKRLEELRQKKNATNP